MSLGRMASAGNIVARHDRDDEHERGRALRCRWRWNQVGVAIMLRGCAAHIGLRQAVEDDGDQADGDALFDRLAELQLLQREKQFLAEARGADERGDDDHGERLHHHLVEAEQQGLLGGR